METATKQVETTNRLARKLTPRDNSNRRGSILYNGPRGRGPRLPPEGTISPPPISSTTRSHSASTEEESKFGNLATRIFRWREITNDTYILSCIEGYKLEFANTPPQKSHTFQPKFSVKESIAIDSELVRLVCIGAIERCDHEQGEFVSHIFARQKSCGKI